MSDKCNNEGNKRTHRHIPVFAIVIVGILINCFTLGMMILLIWSVGGFNHLHRNVFPDEIEIETYEVSDVADSVTISEPESADKVIQNQDVRNLTISEPEPADKVIQNQNVRNVRKVTKKPAAPVKNSTSVKSNDNLNKTQHITLNREDEAKDLSLFTMADTVNYRITGRLTVHTLRKGEFLTKLSLKYYGTKKLWPYIAKYNNISSTTDMMPGKKVIIPQLKYVGGKHTDTDKQTVVEEPTVVIQQPVVDEQPVVNEQPVASDVTADIENDNSVNDEKTESEENTLLNVLASDMSNAEIKQVILDMELEAQDVSKKNNIVNGANDIYAIVDQMPSFAGDYGKLIHYFQDNIEYPPVCKNNGIEGRVTVTFVVEKDGSITNARVIKGVHNEIDKEALRVVSNMPKWNPGRNNGEPVRVLQPITISFSLRKE